MVTINHWIIFGALWLLFACSSEESTSSGWREARAPLEVPPPSGGEEATPQGEQTSSGDSGVTQADGGAAPSVSPEEAREDVLRCAEFFAVRIVDEAVKTATLAKIKKTRGGNEAFAKLREEVAAERDIAKRFDGLTKVAGTLLEVGATPRVGGLLDSAEKVLERLLAKTAADIERECARDNTAYSFCSSVESNPEHQLEGEFEELATLNEEAGRWARAYDLATRVRDESFFRSITSRYTDDCGVKQVEELLGEGSRDFVYQHAVEQMSLDGGGCKGTRLRELVSSDEALFRDLVTIRLDLLGGKNGQATLATKRSFEAISKFPEGLKRARAATALTAVYLSVNDRDNAHRALTLANDSLTKTTEPERAGVAFLLAPLAAALEKAEVARALVSSVAAGSPAEELLGLKAVVYARLGELDQSQELIKTAPEKLRPELLSRVALIAAQKQGSDQTTASAPELLEQAWTALGELGVAEDASDLLDVIAFAQVRSKNHERTAKVLSKLRGKAPAEMIQQTRAKLAVASARAPEAAAARATYFLLTQIRPVEEAPPIAKQAFESLLDNGRTVLAIRAIELFEFPLDQTEALITISRYLSGTGRAEPAVGEKRALAKLVESLVPSTP